MLRTELTIAGNALPTVPELFRVLDERSVAWTISPYPSSRWAQVVYPDVPAEEAVERLWQDIAHLCRLDEPDPAEAWNRRAYVYFVQNNIERALGDLRRALALDPNHFKALDGLGQILREIGQKKGALKAFQQLLDVHPFWQGAKQAVEELERDVDGQGI